MTRPKDEHPLRFQKVQAVRRPTTRNQASLFNFVTNTGSLVESEYRWIREGVDLAAVAREEEHSWFNGILEDILNGISKGLTHVSGDRFPRIFIAPLPEYHVASSPGLLKLTSLLLQAIFRTKEQRIIAGQEDVSLMSPYRLDILLRLVLTILAAVMLLIPVIILFAPATVLVTDTYSLLLHLVVLGFVFFCHQSKTTRSFRSHCGILRRSCSVPR